MNRAECERLIADYLRWLKEGLQVSQLEGSCRVATPFLDRHNDEIELYVEKRNGGLLLTDDGYTIADLASSGMTFGTDKRKALAAVRAYDIEPLMWSRREEGAALLNGG